MKKIILLCFLALAGGSFAQQIEFDRSFGDTGVVSGKGVPYIEQIVSLPDGKILCLGTRMNNKGVEQPAIFKFDSHGKLDSTFNEDGILQDTIKKNRSIPGLYHYNFMSVQPDGRIYMAGSGSDCPFYLSCNDSNGNPISSFGTSGVLKLNTIEYVNRPFLVGFAAAPNNNIIACWNGYYMKGTTAYGFFLSKFDSTGLIDRSFGIDGFVILKYLIDSPYYFYTFNVLKDGSILCAGMDNGDFVNKKTALIKLNADGTLNNNFGIQGKVIIDADTCHGTDIFDLSYLETARKVVEMEDHRLIVISSTDTYNKNDHILRLMPDGALDKTFGNNGLSEGLTNINDVAVLWDGSLVACNGGGYTYFSPNGIADNSNYLKYPFDIKSVAIQDDNKLLFGGINPQDTINTYPILVRMNIDTSVRIPKITAPTTEVSISPIPFRDVITFRSDQSLIRKITLYDLNGRCVYSTLTDYQSCTIRINLSKGIYVCKVETSKGVEYHKIAKGD